MFGYTCIYGIKIGNNTRLQNPKVTVYHLVLMSGNNNSNQIGEITIQFAFIFKEKFNDSYIIFQNMKEQSYLSNDLTFHKLDAL